MSAQITRAGALDLQVCVPATWDDAAVKSFADRKIPCGTEDGWQIRRAGSPSLRGAAERVPCAHLADHVHIMMDA